MSCKRPRTPTTHTPSSSPSPSPEPAPKAARASPPTGTVHPLLCTLPPTCNPPHRPTPLANTKELETHYATYHAHVCEERGCRCVFPDARLLELHQTECHDPIAAVRKERGEKIFACHLASCTRLFATPKTRRLHLISAHGYPKEYFFAVTNKGVGGLLVKWGEGASMLRGQWTARSDEHENDDGDETHDHDTQDDHDTSTSTSTSPATSTQIPPTAAAAAATPPKPKTWLSDAPLVEEDSDDDRDGKKEGDRDAELAGALDSLSLVPAAVRFGRGGSTSNAQARARGSPNRRRTHAHSRGPSRDANAMDVDVMPLHSERGRGRGGRGTGNGNGTARGGAVENANGPGGNGQAPAARPPMPPRGLGRGARGRFAGRARMMLGVGRRG